MEIQEYTINFKSIIFDPKNPKSKENAIKYFDLHKPNNITSTEDIDFDILVENEIMTKFEDSEEPIFEYNVKNIFCKVLDILKNPYYIINLTSFSDCFLFVKARAKDLNKTTHFYDYEKN